MTFQELYEQKMSEAGGNRPLAWMQELAVAAVISTDSVYQYGKGLRHPSGAAATLISQYLGIPASELFPTKFAQS